MVLFRVSWPHVVCQVLTSPCSWEVGEGSGHTHGGSENQTDRGMAQAASLQLRAAVSTNQEGGNRKELCGIQPWAS